MDTLAPDSATFTYDARKVFAGSFGARDPMRYVADAFRHCERTECTVAEYIAGARLAWCDPARPAYWDCVERALSFFEAHPNARQVRHAFRRNAPRCFTESMLARGSYLDAMAEASSARARGSFAMARAALSRARCYRAA